jgi:NADPH:quinone reductase-like Zn-dependent oxidoreductase
MKAILVKNYGGPEVLRFADAPDPSPGANELLVRVGAVSINPIDIKRRTGEMQSFAPIAFPGIIGADVAGTVVKCGARVKNFKVGDQVFAMAGNSYAELCVVNADAAAKIPPGLDLQQAAALPVVVTTGYQLAVNGAKADHGKLILVTGAVGSVGRSAVFAAKSHGAHVIAGVRKSQIHTAKNLGADEVVAIDDAKAIAELPSLDAVADTVNGSTAELLIGKVKSGGVFASVLGPPSNAAKYPKVTATPVFAEPDTKILTLFGKAITDGKFTIPIAAKFPLAEARKAHETIATDRPVGKVLLIP